MLNYIKVAAGSPRIKVADCNYNSDEIISLVIEAYNKDISIIVFPELSITGYTCGDLFFQTSLLSSAENALEKILDSTKSLNIIVVVGLPILHENKLFNCGAVLYNGTLLALIPKTKIPTNGKFAENSIFSPSSDLTNNYIDFYGHSVPIDANVLFNHNSSPIIMGIEIGEDTFGAISKSTYDTLSGANIILNLSSDCQVSPINNRLKNNIINKSRQSISAFILASSSIHESTTDFVFNGQCNICENGNVLEESEFFNKDSFFISSEIDFDYLIKERLINKDIFNDNYGLTLPKYTFINIPIVIKEVISLSRDIPINPYLPTCEDERDKSINNIFTAQSIGLSKRLIHTNIKKAIIAVSGGLDSTLALIATVKAFDDLSRPRTDIIGITMPGFGTSDRTYNNAKSLMKSLGITIREISIKDACILHFKDIGHDINIQNTTYENAQARERTQIAMDIANMENGLVVGTGDLSELALGFATYNGDHMSMYNVNSGIPKTLIRLITTWVANRNILGRDSSAILTDIVNTPVSPELLPPSEDGNINQVTENILGPYEINDFFLYYIVKYGYSPHKILFMAKHAFNNKYSEDELLNILKNFYKRFFTQQYKRSCSPDGPKVIDISLSPRGGYKMPSDASYKIWLEEIQSI